MYIYIHSTIEFWNQSALYLWLMASDAEENIWITVTETR